MPTIVWVAPSGGRAASAGTFITLAANLAVHGAGDQHRCRVAGRRATARTSRARSARRSRTTRSPTSRRSRRRAAGRSSGPCRPSTRRRPTRPAEAVAAGAVDGIAATIDEVLAQANGQEVTVGGRDRRPWTSPARPSRRPAMNPFQGLLHLLSDPNIAFVLFTIGFYGLIFELQNPNFVTGILGALAIILAFIGFGSLPLNVGRAAADRPRRRAVRARGRPSPATACWPSAGSSASRWARPRCTPTPGDPSEPIVTVALPLIVTSTATTAILMGLDHARRDPDPPHGATVGHGRQRPCRSGPRASSRPRSSRWAPSISRARRGAPGPPDEPARSRGIRRSAWSASTASPPSSSGPRTRRRPRHFRRKAYPLREGRRPPLPTRRRHSWS